MLDLQLLREAHGGFCVARHEGKVVFVRGGLPGERVRAVVTAEGARHDTARVVEVLDPSPDRVEHVWPAAAREDVGGADLGHVRPAAQLTWKANVIADVMARIGGPAVVEALPGPTAVRAVGDPSVGSRTRVSFTVDDAGRLAMRRPRSHDLVAVREMPLAVPGLAALDLFAGAWGWVPGDRVTAVVPSGSPPVVVTGAGVLAAPGREAERRVRERVPHEGEDLRYVVDAAGFWQVHREAPETLVHQVLAGAALTGGERVLELFAGAGLLTLPLARAVGARGEVVSVEGSRTAVDDATVTLAALPHARVRRARADARTVGRLPGPLDVVVLDPPRTGAGRDLVRAVAAHAPERIVYVACDPAALARDLRDLVGGYAITAFTALDLFPHTHHVEIVAVLQRHAGTGASH